MIDFIHYKKDCFKLQYFKPKLIKNNLLIIFPRETKSEKLFGHILIGQKRLMLLHMFKDIEINELKINLINFNKKIDFEKLILQFQPKSIILYDNKDKVIEKKLKKILKNLQINFQFLIHPEKILEHGAKQHPNYLEQLQLLKGVIYVNN